jgi:hypothetical protein
MVGGSGAFCRSVQSSRLSGEIVRQIGEVINEDYIDVDLFDARGRRVCGICCQDDPPPLDSTGSGPCCFFIPSTGLSRASADRSALRRVRRHAYHIPGLSWTLNQSRRYAPSCDGGQLEIGGHQTRRNQYVRLLTQEGSLKPQEVVGTWRLLFRGVQVPQFTCRGQFPIGRWELKLGNAAG